MRFWPSLFALALLAACGGSNVEPSPTPARVVDIVDEYAVPPGLRAVAYETSSTFSAGDRVDIVSVSPSGDTLVASNIRVERFDGVWAVVLLTPKAVAYGQSLGGTIELRRL